MAHPLAALENRKILMRLPWNLTAQLLLGSNEAIKPLGISDGIGDGDNGGAGGAGDVCESEPGGGPLAGPFD